MRVEVPFTVMNLSYALSRIGNADSFVDITMSSSHSKVDTIQMHNSKRPCISECIGLVSREPLAGIYLPMVGNIYVTTSLRVPL